MEKLLARVALLLCALWLAPSPVRAEILTDGTDTTKPVVVQPRVVLPNQCSMLWFDPTMASFPSEVPRMAALGFNIDATNDPSQINPLNLANHDVLVIAYTPPPMLGPLQPVIQAWVQAGHGLFIHQPNAQGVVSYAPVGLEVTILSPAWCNYPSESVSATIVNPAHPITSGLFDTSLSGAFDFVGAMSGGWNVLTRSVVCGDPALAVGASGLGRVVFDDGNGSPLAIIPGAEPYWAGIFNWLCSSGVVPTRKSTWGTLKAIYR